MRSCGLVFVMVAAVLLIDCTATFQEEAAATHDKERAGGSESWTEWAKGKLSQGLGFKTSDDRDSSNTHQLTKDKAGCVTGAAEDKAGCVEGAAEDKACELAEETKKKAAETGEVEDKVKGKVCDMGKKVAEEGKKREAEAEDTLNWAKEGYEAAKSMAQEAYESGKEKLSHHQEL